MRICSGCHRDLESRQRKWCKVCITYRKKSPHIPGHLSGYRSPVAMEYDTPEHQERIRLYTERAAKGLPLFSKEVKDGHPHQ